MISSQRRKVLKQNPRSITSDEMLELLAQAHEIQNLRTQIESLKRTALQHQTLYHGSNSTADARGKQIQALGHALDEERKIAPEARAAARAALKDVDKPSEVQVAGVGAYVAPIAPTAENL
ncbi:hypothetical protein PEC311524_36260 [Pectobacterium carotovorum subsp. carotovorum]|nr:hypothetical protein PEC311524_36260 [Pectobacterium carotovorum subsp. carotovorum]